MRKSTRQEIESFEAADKFRRKSALDIVRDMVGQYDVGSYITLDDDTMEMTKGTFLQYLRIAVRERGLRIVRHGNIIKLEKIDG